jgi:phage N-6-adenine-methyltransferase
MRDGTEIVQYQTIRTRQAKADALIDYGAKIRDWPLIEQAVDAKIADQREFVDWWDDTVRPAGGDKRSGTISADRALMIAEDAEARTGISHQLVSRWRNRLKDTAKYRDKQILAAYRKAEIEPAENHRAEGTGENEWFTPGKYIEAARTVMGGIDLDPATHLVAQQTVRADAYYTAADNGLVQPWYGRVWLNPPYAQPLVGQFIDRLVSQYADGAVSQAVLLTHNYTDTAWFHQAAASAAVICFTRGRIAFVNPDGEACAPTQGQAFFYYGAHREAFAAAFVPIGVVLATC